jgi:uncharacterized membrane protein
MNPTPDATTADNGGTFDPRQAAALLDQSTRLARRKLEPSPPWLLATRAVLVLAALGAIWFSVRGQHPYQGPTAADIPVLVAFIVINFFATVGVRMRANTGVRGKSKLRPAEIAILTAAWVSVPVLITALAAAGVSLAKYPTTVLIVPGLAWAAVSAARANWVSFGTGVAVTVVGVAGAFAGPVGSWAVAGVGLCAVLLALAAVRLRRQRG